jgi:hypothetical protein
MFFLSSNRTEQVGVAVMFWIITRAVLGSILISVQFFVIFFMSVSEYQGNALK